MTIGASLGDAVLELRTDNAKFDSGMREAEGGLHRLREELGIVHDAVELLEQAFEFFKGVGEFLGEFVSAAGRAEQSTVRLQSALHASGEEGHGAEEEMKGLATELSHYTTSTAGAIRNTEALLLQFGVSRGDMARTAHAALDLSAALGIDLHGATMLLAKASEGNTAALGRYGIKIDETVPKADRFAAVLDQIQQRFGGMAEAEGNTFLGLWERVKNAFEEVYVAIGNVVIQSPVLRSVMESMQQGFEDLHDWIGESNKTMTAWLDFAVLKGIEYLQEFVGWVERIARSVGFTPLAEGLHVLDDRLGETLGKAQNSFGQVISLVKTVGDTWVYVSSKVSGTPLAPGFDSEKIDGQMHEWAAELVDFMVALGEQVSHAIWDRFVNYEKSALRVIVSDLSGTLSDLAHMIFMGPTFAAQAEGSPKLPFTSYFEHYAPNVLSGFANNANNSILDLQSNLSDFVQNAQKAVGMVGNPSDRNKPGQLAHPTTPQYRDPYSAYKAGAPGSGYAFTPYGEGGGDYWGQGTKYWAGGFSGLVTQPQHFVAGESGAEWVEVTPGGKPAAGGSGGGASGGGWEAVASLLERTARASEQVAAAWTNPGSGYRQSEYQTYNNRYASGSRGASN